jgi:hypothetical protein
MAKGMALAFSIRAWRFESVGSKLVCLPRYVLHDTSRG